jgi:hypothetical protein
MIFTGFDECTVLNGHQACLQCGRSFFLRPGRVKPKTMQLVFVVSPLSTQH